MDEFEMLYTTRHELVFRFLVKLCRDSSLAEELTQETFFRAYMNHSSLRDKTKAATWLCSIAKNTYFAYLKEQKKLVNLEDLTQIFSDSSVKSTEDKYILTEEAERAMKLLNELDEPYRDVFTLSVLGSLSLKEISEIYGKSESWARVTFYRARQKLHEKLKD